VKPGWAMIVPWCFLECQVAALASSFRDGDGPHRQQLIIVNKNPVVFFNAEDNHKKTSVS
jgi:hypothetical protein